MVSARPQRPCGEQGPDTHQERCFEPRFVLDFASLYRQPMLAMKEMCDVGQG